METLRQRRKNGHKDTLKRLKKNVHRNTKTNKETGHSKH